MTTGARLGARTELAAAATAVCANKGAVDKVPSASSAKEDFFMKFPLNKENVQSTALPAQVRGGMQPTQELTKSGRAAGMKRRKPTDREQASKRHRRQGHELSG